MCSARPLVIPLLVFAGMEVKSFAHLGPEHLRRPNCSVHLAKDASHGKHVKYTAQGWGRFSSGAHPGQAKWQELATKSWSFDHAEIVAAALLVAAELPLEDQLAAAVRAACEVWGGGRWAIP